MHLDKTLPTMVNQAFLAQPDEEFPTMVGQASPVQPDRESQNLVEQICASIPSEQADSVSFIPASPTKNPEKSNYLEEIIMNIKKKKIISDEQFEKQFSQNLMFKLKNDLKTNKKATVNYIKDCFRNMLDNMDFLSWLSVRVGYKPNRMKKLLAEKAPNNHKLLDATVYQEIYNFWLSESINSNDGRTNVVNISKSLFLQQYKFIKDENLVEKEVKLKHCTKRILYTGRKIYTESLRNLHERFNTTQNENVSLSVFHSYKPYYLSKPTKKEKTSCLCIDCLNPHLLLKPINNYRKSRNLNVYQSLSMYLNENKSDNDLFPETKEENQLYYYVYERKIEYYKGKDDKDVQYTRTARVDKKDKVSAIVGKLVQISQRYLKHRSYVDNVSRVLPMIKDGFSGKYKELDFSENLALRPKHEVQSAYFSGKQHTLHCAIFPPGETKFHYHISEDTKHDPVFVDEVLRDLIHPYDLRKENIMIQSDNAPISN